LPGNGSPVGAPAGKEGHELRERDIDKSDKRLAGILIFLELYSRKK
jgi:hypothetical protein